jgi:glucose-1-phosphate thymidylyltransferase
LLGDGRALGISITYAEQPKPDGLAQAFLIGREFIGNESVILILGDNIFYGPGLGRRLSEDKDINGAKIFGVKVKDPERYGVVEATEEGLVLSIEEKPANPRSDIAVPGIYFFDNTVSVRAAKVTKSSRGELEITSVLESYLNDNLLELKILDSNTAWTVDSLNEAANFVRSTELSISFKIGCIEEVAFRKGWISNIELRNLINKLGKNEYSQYLQTILLKNELYER